MKEINPLFITRLQEIFPQNYETILKSLWEDRLGSFRINTLKSSKEEVLKEFWTKNIPVEEFFSMENIFTFDKKFEYTIKGTKSFYEGKIYLQSIASMIPVFALEPKKWEKILDVCAAPWSKTTQIAMLQENNGKITALEKNQIRYDKLNYNITLQNALNIETQKTDALKFFINNSELFDKILLDVPCSAEWRIHLQKEKTFAFWSEKNILEKAQLQKDLLHWAWKNLKKNGILVYSTCTLAPEENEHLISQFLHNHSDAEILPISINMENTNFWWKNIENFHGSNFENLKNFGVRILPTKMTDGFFIAKLQKKSN